MTDKAVSVFAMQLGNYISTIKESFFCLEQSLSVLKVCILFATNSAMYHSVLVNAAVFELSSGSVYISSIFNLEIATAKMLSVPLIWTKVRL